MVLVASCALAACGDNLGAPIDAPGPADATDATATSATIEVSPPAIDFGTVALGTSETITLTVRNAGPDLAGALDVTLQGASTVEKASDACNNVVLGVDRTCQIVLRFTPASTLATTASLRIVASPGGSLLVPIEGHGDDTRGMSISPPAHVFSGYVGVPSDSETFTVTNLSAAVALSPLSTTIAGPDPTAFSITSDTCGGVALAPSATCTVSVAFTGFQASPSTAFLQVTSGTIMLVGDLSGTTQGKAFLLTINPTLRDFGAVTPGLQSVPHAFVIANDGALTTGNLSVALGGANPSAFELEDTCSGTALGGGQSCTVSVRFSPSSPQAYAATLTVTAVPGGVASAGLLGTGIDIHLVGTPTAHDFGAIPPGVTSAAQSFTFTNTGNAPTGNLTISLGGVDPTHFVLTDPCSGSPLPGGQSCTVTVAFAPTSAGAKSASLSLSASPGGVVQLGLAGSGQ